ncbi:DUF4080 domain-containing protein [Peptoanaerobacter stomatis]|uniref:B12-binding domain-containing radical SAM protein n=1 Tax=Peptoanaerobacter stomatis TaxID=796937 RepID=UPI003FA0E3A9
MKILLTTLNSKFIHSSLALKYLYNNIYDIADVSVREYTINENLQDIFCDIMSENYDLIAFSTYIWNVEHILKLCCDIKLANPYTKLLFGGPEVSFDSIDFMKKNDMVDYIIRDEGEIVFRKFIMAYEDKSFENVESLTYRKNEEIIENIDARPIENLGMIRGAYDIFDENSIKDKIVYYETSRGCCYNCSYCLSSVTKSVRFFPYKKVISDLEKLVSLGAKQIKFVDRTFNYDKKRTIDLIKYLCTLDNGGINFHFEITAHIMQDDLLDALKNVRQGLFQFEIGVQSTNKQTIKAVNRIDNFDELSKKVRKIKSFGNIHQHLDLIAGLPYENLDSFKHSFNDVMALEPDNLQLGFLKMLKGSPINSVVGQFAIKYRNYAPYEVISTQFLSYKDIFLLKDVESVLEEYYNSMTFNYSMKFILSKIDNDYFSFFERFCNFKKGNDYNKNLSRDDRFYLLFDYARSFLSGKNIYFFKELLRFDYLLMGRNRVIPEFLKNDTCKLNSQIKKDIIADIDLSKKFDINTEIKNINSVINIELFDIDIEKFDKENIPEKKESYVVFNYFGAKNFRNIVNFYVY